MRGAAYCMNCIAEADRQKGAANRAVKSAILAGQLKPPHLLKCVDCGADAKFYDHRFYAQPLNVVPVCHACNVYRGPAEYIKLHGVAA